MVTALRETEEEVGIGKYMLSVHDDVKDELRYTVWKRRKQRQKAVTYWLVSLLDTQFKVALEKFQQKLENMNWTDN